MSKVKLDRIEGSSLRRMAEGFEAVRVAYVIGLGGDACGRLRQAVEAEGIPRVGQPHPTIENLVVQLVAVEPDGPHAAKVLIHYRSREVGGGSAGGGRVEVGSTLNQRLTETNLSGERITVAYTATGDDSDLQIQGTRVPALRPQTTLQFSRNESNNPARLARQFVGTVNQARIFDGDSQTWLCTAITGKSSDGAVSFDVTYEFQHNADGWQPQVSYIDPRTNRPPADLVLGVGLKEIAIYKQTDFRELGLTL